jgi:predicted NAD/FAD-dependent oxidoreductase
MSRLTPIRPGGRAWSRREFLKSGGLATLAAGSGILAAASPRQGAAPAAGGAYDAVVVGGGIAGLTAAYYLNGLKVRVLEREAGPGGRIRGGGGVRDEMARATYMGRPYGALKEIIERLGLEPWEIRAPLEAVFRDDRIHFGPEGTAQLLAERSSAADFERFRSEVLAHAAAYQDIPELDFTIPAARLDDVPARRWFDGLKLPPVYADFYDLAARSRFGVSLDDLSALALIPEMAFGLGGGTGDAALPEAGGSGAFTFDGGLAALATALADWLADVFQPGSRVVRVSKPDGDYRVEYADAAGKIRSLRAKFVILAVPAAEALALDSGALKAEARRLLTEVAYSSAASVALRTRESLFGRAFQLALAGGGEAVSLRDTFWLANGRQAAGAAAGGAGTLVVQAAPAKRGDAAWARLSDDDLSKAAVRAVSRIFPGLPGQIAGRQVVRHARAYPVMGPGAFRRAARLNEICDGRILLAGDYMIYPDFEAAADSGDFAAEKIRELI